MGRATDGFASGKLTDWTLGYIVKREIKGGDDGQTEERG